MGHKIRLTIPKQLERPHSYFYTFNNGDAAIDKAFWKQC